MSNRPVNEGHTLVVPKKHYENIYDIPEDEIAYLFKIVKRVAHAVRDAMAAEGIRVVQNNGWAAGQVIFHFHVHVIPMKPHEGFTHGKAYRDQSQGRMPEALRAGCSANSSAPHRGLVDACSGFDFAKGQLQFAMLASWALLNACTL